MKTYTMGAMADSYYEYLLKMWLIKQQKVCQNAHVKHAVSARLVNWLR